MKRRERLGAIVEELRDAAPQPCTAAQLARRFAVSTRTIERDVLALQGSGVPIWSSPGALGGYTFDPGETLPAVDLTVAEVAALTQALAVPATLPYAAAARTARAKLLASLSASAVEGAGDLAGRLALLPSPDPVRATVPRLVEQAVLDREQLAITCADETLEVDPLALAGDGDHWYLVADTPAGTPRAFRLDRLTMVRPTGRYAPPGLPVPGTRFAAAVRHPERHDT